MAAPLWSPDPNTIPDLQITRFAEILGESDYPSLHRRSVAEKAAFWSAVWNFCDVVGDPGDTALVDEDAMPGARFFPNGSLNFAENLLRFSDDRAAIVSILENGRRAEISYAELNARTAALANWLKQQGVSPSDRVAAFMPNVIETVVAMLATTSIGAIFSSCSPDFGKEGVVDRFGQIAPRVLICANGYFYGGKRIDSTPRINEIVRTVDSIEQVVRVDILDDAPELEVPVPVTAFEHIRSEAVAPDFVRMPFNHPLYVMYSSGTTGTPKCIVHGAGGTLLQHVKEHRLHVDLRREDVFFYFTTCGWMMWNWLVSGLASGATLLLYDGSPFYPEPKTMFDIAEREGITVFGTSARFIAAVEKEHVMPKETHDLSRLRTILSTGSPLTHESFRYVYRDVKTDVCLSSISGGTDIISCFVLGNPALPVYEGELQCIGLGMDVHIFDDTGNAVVGEKGELVCTSPFPSMPVGFWNDEGEEKYRDAYFSRFPGVWAHGDYGELTGHGGMIIHGRSDAVLNPGGVRIGTAEIYRQVERVEDVVDAVCVGQDWEGDVRVILFVVLRDGVDLDEALVADIKRVIRENTTPRHVPAKVLSVPEIPRTISGKVVELAVRDMIHGKPVVNTDALANPDALEAFRDRPELIS